MPNILIARQLSCSTVCVLVGRPERALAGVWFHIASYPDLPVFFKVSHKKIIKITWEDLGTMLVSHICMFMHILGLKVGR